MTGKGNQLAVLRATLEWFSAFINITRDRKLLQNWNFSHAKILESRGQVRTSKRLAQSENKTVFFVFSVISVVSFAWL